MNTSPIAIKRKNGKEFTFGAQKLPVIFSTTDLVADEEPQSPSNFGHLVKETPFKHKPSLHRRLNQELSSISLPDPVRRNSVNITPMGPNVDSPKISFAKQNFGPSLRRQSVQIATPR